MFRALLALAILGMSSCAVSTIYVQDGSKTYSSLDPKTVKIFAADTLSNRYNVIGSIAVDKTGDGDDALELLKEKAASVGANAVIGVRLTKMSSFARRTGLSGIAVRTY